MPFGPCVQRGLDPPSPRCLLSGAQCGLNGPSGPDFGQAALFLVGRFGSSPLVLWRFVVLSVLAVGFVQPFVNSEIRTQLSSRQKWLEPSFSTTVSL